MARETVEVAIVGGGPAGLTAAVALAGAGVPVALVSPAPVSLQDHRTTALFGGSVTALETLGVWEACRPHAAPMHEMRLVDATARLWRAPEVRFTAREIDLDAFGANIENRHLLAALEARAAALPSLTRYPVVATTIAPGPEGVTVTLADGRTLDARLVIGADGRKSACRTAAGIATQAHDYPQHALTLNFAHTRPHRNISTEFHTETGPFTLVPLPGLRSSLVWVLDPAGAKRLGALDDKALGEAIEQQAHSLLGKVTPEPGRGLFPLRVETARHFAALRIGLIGEAAHVIPPIGAQGLNLGLRDAATLSELVIAAHRAGHDVGGPEVTNAYDSARRADVGARTLAVDLMNRSLLTDFLPVQGLRGVGLYLAGRVGPLRRALMREGVTPAASQPRLMRGEAL
ncbi:MAG: 2-octaprenyl-6-methoxyphenol hydroxylase [Xanthobacteraceae bacterium]|nr:2-octaprenyl-6-methoxyphenol hydroxylase [Xanthobacteraceae bacterium]